MASLATIWFWADAPVLRYTSPQSTAIDSVPYFRWIAWAFVFFGLLPLVMAYLVWAERKVAGRFQDRIGPNRVGPLGLLQSIADAIKLITKENLIPASADRWVHALAPVLLLVSAFLMLAVIPFGGEGAVNPPSGLLYLIAVSSLSSLGVFLAGWSSRNKFSLIGAMRAVAQLVSYEVPQVLALVPVVLWAGSLSLVAIFDAQVERGWFLFSPPGLLSFLIFTIANFAELNRAPFDLPEAESEIVAGFHTEYSGMRWSLFFLGEYLGIFALGGLGTALFLGGGTLPFVGGSVVRAIGTASWPAYCLTNSLLAIGFMLKVALYIFVFFWVRATLPRLRVDRLMDFAWKYLVPLSLANILIAAAWFELTIRPGSPGVLVGWLVTAPLVVGSVIAVSALNRSSSNAGPVREALR